jgi:hypothetical protein
MVFNVYYDSVFTDMNELVELNTTALRFYGGKRFELWNAESLAAPVHEAAQLLCYSSIYGLCFAGSPSGMKQ